MLIDVLDSGEGEAVSVHKKVGEEVRDTIRKLGGTMPESLPLEPSIKRLEKAKKEKKALKPKD